MITNATLRRDMHLLTAQHETHEHRALNAHDTLLCLEQHEG